MKILLIRNSQKKPIKINLSIATFFAALFFFSSAYIFIKFINYPDNSSLGLTGVDTIVGMNNDLLSHKEYEKKLNVYIKQIGELNIRLENLDKQTERIQGVLKKQIVGKYKVPVMDKRSSKSKKKSFPSNGELSQNNIGQTLQLLMEAVESRENLSNQIEAMVLKQSVLKNTLPSLYPVDVPYRSSSFGWRHDPFLGTRAFHSGLDFSAATGEPIKASASGIVIVASIGPKYGKFIKIKHGDGLETLYAHASKLYVKKGDIVQREQIIGLVGSTGRSTGPHLHYEIRLNGRALDPRQYIKK